MSAPNLEVFKYTTNHNKEYTLLFDELKETYRTINTTLVSLSDLFEKASRVYEKIVVRTTKANEVLN